MQNNKRLIPGYDGSRHAPSSKIASNVKKLGHKKEHIFAERYGGEVVKGVQKPDVIKGSERISVKGAKKNIQLLLLRLPRCVKIYGMDSLLYGFQFAGKKHRDFKFKNNNQIDPDLFNTWKNAAHVLADWLRCKDNFRMVIEKVFSDDYDANKLAILKDVDQDAFLYEMKDVCDLYVESYFQVRVTDNAKIVVSVDKREIFYLEIRGGKDHCGSMNHGVRSPQLYDFLEANLEYKIIP